MSSNIKENNNIQELIAHIRERPELYIRPLSVSQLRCFLDGYYHARWEIIEGPDNFGTMNEFQEMVQKRYSMNSTFGWDRILTFFAGSEREGLELFWRLWDEHLTNQKSSNQEESSE